ncbi:hypothetical protein Barb4_00640 [Bacteroidales bacterium Barb4]|nr:hypothetical protein Barb4_00640 [Bacteroidales bacterium Barb4]
MQRSGMWGYKDAADNGVLKERPNIICCILYRSFRTFLTALSVTPHSAPLHVGLKSCVLAGLHRVALSANPTFRFASCGAEISSPCGTFYVTS